MCQRQDMLSFALRIRARPTRQRHDTLAALRGLSRVVIRARTSMDAPRTAPQPPGSTVCPEFRGRPTHLRDFQEVVPCALQRIRIHHGIFPCINENGNLLKDHLRWKTLRHAFGNILELVSSYCQVRPGLESEPTCHDVLALVSCRGKLLRNFFKARDHGNCRLTIQSSLDRHVQNWTLVIPASAAQCGDTARTTHRSSSVLASKNPPVDMSKWTFGTMMDHVYGMAALNYGDSLVGLAWHRPHQGQHIF